MMYWFYKDFKTKYIEEFRSQSMINSLQKLINDGDYFGEGWNYFF